MTGPLAYQSPASPCRTGSPRRLWEYEELENGSGGQEYAVALALQVYADYAGYVSRASTQSLHCGGRTRAVAEGRHHPRDP